MPPGLRDLRARNRSVRSIRRVAVAAVAAVAAAAVAAAAVGIVTRTPGKAGDAERARGCEELPAVYAVW